MKWLKLECSNCILYLLCNHPDHPDVEIGKWRNFNIILSYGDCCEEKCPKVEKEGDEDG